MFREALTNCTEARPVIYLTDLKFETADVVGNFLDLVDGSWYPHAKLADGEHDIDKIGLLLDFCDKWECFVVAKALVGALQPFPTLGSTVSDFYTEPFILAAQHGALDLCELFIVHQVGPVRQMWNTEHPSVKDGEAIANHWLLDPCAMPKSMVKRTPLPYLYGLSKAVCVFRQSNGKIGIWTDLGRSDWIKLGEDFRECVEKWDK